MTEARGGEPQLAVLCPRALGVRGSGVSSCYRWGGGTLRPVWAPLTLASTEAPPPPASCAQWQEMEGGAAAHTAPHPHQAPGSLLSHAIVCADA